MEKIATCEERSGLFIVRNCENPFSNTCEKCKKNICEIHSFKSNSLKLEDFKNTILCLSCFSDLDTRLTSEYELYSKDRAVWRKKMMQRFHSEYPYMQFLAEDYGSLFDTTGPFYSSVYSDDDDSFFDS